MTEHKILSVKRKRTEDPVEIFVIDSAKRAKPTTIFKLFASADQVSTQEIISNQIQPKESRPPVKSIQQNRDVVADQIVQSKLARYKVVSEKRAASYSLLHVEKHSPENYGIPKVLNSKDLLSNYQGMNEELDKMIQHEEEDYVYDLYFHDQDAEVDHANLAATAALDWEQDYVYFENEEEKNSDWEEGEEDSNDEDNWRNEYPEESEHSDWEQEFDVESEKEFTDGLYDDDY